MDLPSAPPDGLRLRALALSMRYWTGRRVAGDRWHGLWLRRCGKRAGLGGSDSTNVVPREA